MRSELLDAVLASDHPRMRHELNRRPNLDAWDDHGMTPLLYAVFRGDIEAVRLMLQAGADSNRPQGSDPTATPLWHARDDFGLREIAEVLVQFGAVR